jgi:uncharacterized protein YggU (UPF0235/DUF167 family)
MAGYLQTQQGEENENIVQFFSRAFGIAKGSIA